MKKQIELLKIFFMTGLEILIKNDKNWKIVDVKETAIDKKGAIRMGPFGSQLKKSELVDSGVRVLWIENLVNNQFEYKYGKFITEKKFLQLIGFKVNPNNILVTMMGTIGRIAIVPKDIEKAIISSHLLKIEVDEDKFNPIFLKHMLLSPFVQNQWKKESHGIVMSGLNSKIIKSTKIIKPPIELQNQFAEMVKKIESLKTKQNRTTEEINNLFDCLMQKAFKGELVS